jgi:flagellar basal body-associated protein FliL
MKLKVLKTKKKHILILQIVTAATLFLIFAVLSFVFVDYMTHNRPAKTASETLISLYRQIESGLIVTAAVKQ